VVSSRDRCDQRRGPDNVHDPGQIVGQNDEPFRGYFWKRFGEKVRRSHADLYRAERMFDCFSPPAIKGKPDRDRSIEKGLTRIGNRLRPDPTNLGPVSRGVPAAAECNRALASKHRIAPAANAALAEGEEPEFARDEAAHGKAVSGDASSAAQIAEAIDCAVVVFQKVSVPKNCGPE
jgi:hypothetical protein